MRRIVALIAMLAVLMSSFVFAEEAVVVTEIVEPVAAVEELPAGEPAAEAPAADETPAEEAVEEEAAEEAAPAAEEIAAEEIAVEETAVMLTAEEAPVEAAAADACEHIVICFQPDYCQLCKQTVTGIEARHPDNITEDDPILCPDDPGKHGYYCVLCGGFAYLEEHFTDCTFEEPNKCAVCQATIDDEYVFHSGLATEYSVIANIPDMHGIYCSACQNYLNAGVHTVSCTSADTSRCDLCKATVDIAVEHNYVNNICIKCGEVMGIQEMEIVAPGGNLGVGEVFQLGITVKPESVIYSMEFNSSKPSIATIDENGVITAKKAGTTKITIETVSPDGAIYKDEFDVTVKKAPTKVTLSHSKLNIYEGQEGQLTASIGGSSYGSTLTWTSSDPSVAFVNENGFVIATGIGEATITVSTFNGKTASCAVSVTGAPVAIEVPAEEVNMYYKQTYDLGAMLVDEFGNECAGTLSYESDYPKNVSVSSKGVVTVKKSAKGSAIITITGAGLTAEVLVNVCDAPSKVTLDETSVELIRGETYQLEPIIEDDEATVFTYSSGKKTVATVDKYGVVTAVGEGSATITVKTHNSKKATLKVTVEDPYKPDSVELSESGTYYLSLGDELELEAVLYPETAESELSWSSSKPKVATGEITDTGCIITPLKEGTTKITVKTYNGKTDTLTVTVVDPYKVAAVELEETGTVALALDEELQLNANILPATADSELKWSSSSKKVATVDEFGLVTPVKVGTATITVKSENGKSDTVKVKVYDPYEPYAVELDQSGTVTINIGEELQLNATVLPDTADTELTWSSSGKTYATVDQDGLVTPKKAGTTTITVKTENGLKDTVKVKVTDKYKPTSIELSNIGAVTVGDVVELVPSLEPATAMTNLSWKSSNEDIATVDADGYVTFHGQGSVTISVKTHNSKTDSMKITVGAAILPDSIAAIPAAGGKVGVGDSIVVETTITPANAKTELSWISSDNSVATVNQQGVVTGVKVGTAIITVTTSNGKIASVVVTVEAESAGVELSTSAGSFAGITSAMGGLKKVEEGGTVYYTDATGSNAVLVNRGSQDVKDRVVSIELVKKSSYRIHGVGIGMSIEEAVAAMQKNGISAADMIVTDDGIFTMSQQFAIIEIALVDGKVASVSALAM